MMHDSFQGQNQTLKKKSCTEFDMSPAAQLKKWSLVLPEHVMLHGKPARSTWCTGGGV